MGDSNRSTIVSAGDDGASGVAGSIAWLIAVREGEDKSGRDVNCSDFNFDRESSFAARPHVEDSGKGTSVLAQGQFLAGVSQNAG
jgi:hypothetical protein